MSEPFYEFVSYEIARWAGDVACYEGRARVGGRLMYCKFFAMREFIADEDRFDRWAMQTIKDSALSLYALDTAPDLM